MTCDTAKAALTFCRSFSCCSVSRFRIAAILAPPAGAAPTEAVLVTGTAAGVLGGAVEEDDVEFARPSLEGVTAFSSFSLSFPELDTRARPIVIGITDAKADFLLGLSFLLPFELADTESSVPAFFFGASTWVIVSTLTTSNSSNPSVS